MWRGEGSCCKVGNLHLVRNWILTSCVCRCIIHIHVYVSHTVFDSCTLLQLMLLQEVPRELYGPVMVVLTMIALLLYQMKSADHKVVSIYAFGCCVLYKTI